MFEQDTSINLSDFLDNSSRTIGTVEKSTDADRLTKSKTLSNIEVSESYQDTCFSDDSETSLKKPAIVYGGSCRAVYIAACMEAKIKPCSYILEHLGDSVLLMRYRGLLPKEMGAFSEAIKRNTKIEELDLSFNGINKKGGLYLVNALETNTYISHLILNGNKIGSSVEQFSGILGSNASCKVLHLDNNSILSSSCLKFAKSLIMNESIMSLHLSDNQILEAGAKAIFKSIKSNQKLIDLDISGNAILFKEDASIVSTCLATNTTLEILNLSNNILGSKFYKPLKTGLLKNDTIRMLDISNVRLTEEDIPFISSILSSHKSLKIVRMEKVIMKETDCYKLIQSAMVRNETLEVLTITNACFSTAEIVSRRDNFYLSVDDSNRFLRLQEFLKNVKLDIVDNYFKRYPHEEIYIRNEKIDAIVEVSLWLEDYPTEIMLKTMENCLLGSNNKCDSIDKKTLKMKTKYESRGAIYTTREISDFLWMLYKFDSYKSNFLAFSAVEQRRFWQSSLMQTLLILQIIDRIPIAKKR